MPSDELRIRDRAALERAVAAGPFLLLKHSTRCPISAAAFEEWTRWRAAHPAAASGWIDVIEERDLAREIAARTGVRHESPQALWFSGGRVSWHASHGDVDADSLAANAPRG